MTEFPVEAFDSNSEFLVGFIFSSGNQGFNGSHFFPANLAGLPRNTSEYEVSSGGHSALSHVVLAQRKAFHPLLLAIRNFPSTRNGVFMPYLIIGDGTVWLKRKGIPRNKRRAQAQDIRLNMLG